MKKLILCLLAAGSCFAQTNVRVAVTSTQVVISYTAPSLSACTLAVSTASGLSPLVNDLITDSTSDTSRSSTVSFGTARTVVVGKQTAVLSNVNGFTTQRISNALQANKGYFYKVTCGGSNVTGTFVTKNIPLGIGYGSPWPTDPTSPGDWAVPSSPGATANEQFIDPQTGIVVQRATYPGYGYSTGTQTTSTGTAYNQGQVPCDAIGPWVNPCNATGSSGFATVTNSNGWIVVRPDTITSNWGDGQLCNNQPSGHFVDPGCGPYIQQLQINITGSGTSATSSARQLDVAISMNAGGSTATTIRNVTLPQTTAAVVSTTANVPGATGIDPWIYDSSPKVTLFDSFHHIGNVSTSGAVVTLTSGDYFDSTWSAGGGGRIRLSNTSTTDACRSSGGSSSEFTVSSGFGKSITLTSSPGSFSFYCAQDFAVMIRRTNPDGTTVSIQSVTISYVTATPGEWLDAGFQTIYAHNTVSGGYLGEMMIGGGGGQLTWFNPADGTANVLGPFVVNAKSTGGGNTWSSAPCPLFSPDTYIDIDDTQSTPTFYCIVTDGSSNLAVLKVALSGSSGALSLSSPNNYASGAAIGTGTLTTSDNYSLTYPFVTITDLTPSSLTKDLGTLITGYIGGAIQIPAAVTGLNCFEGAVQQGNILVYCELHQDTAGWLFVISPGDGDPTHAGTTGAHVIGAMNTWQSASSRYSIIHSLQDYGQSSGLVGYGADPMSAQGPGSSTLGNTAVVVTTSTAVPSAGVDCATWSNPLGVTGNSCIDLTIDSNGGSFEPYYFTSIGAQGTTPGVPATAQPGDSICISEASGCQWPSDGNEYMMLLQKGVGADPSQWIFRRSPFAVVMAPVASGTYTSGGSIAGTGTCTLTSFSRFGAGAAGTIAVSGGVVTPTTITFTNNGGGYTGAPSSATLGSGTGTGVCSGTATISTVLGSADTGSKVLSFLPSSFSNTAGVPEWGGMYPGHSNYDIPSSVFGMNVIWDYQHDASGVANFTDPEGAGGHGYWRPTSAVASSSLPYSPRTNIYNVRHAANVAAITSAPIGLVTANVPFSAVAGPAVANFYQSHAGPSGENASTYEGQAAFDVRPLTGIGTSTPAAGVNQAYTLVTGTIWSNTWSGGTFTDVDNFGPINRKVYATAASAGVHPLVDVSGPSSDITLTSYAYCVTRAGNECYPSSTVGQIYVNVPGVAFPWCYGDPISGTLTPQVNDLCITNASAVGGSGVQFSTLQSDPLGSFQRVLTSTVNGATKYNGGFANMHPLPDNSWALFKGNYLDGISRNVYMAQLPPFPPADSIRRNGFIAVPVVLKPPTALGVNNAIVQFGYQEYGGNCTTRAEACLANAATVSTGNTPFSYTSDAPAGLACSTGCTIAIPAISGKILRYSVQYRDASNNVLTASPTQVLVVP